MAAQAFTFILASSRLWSNLEKI